MALSLILMQKIASMLIWAAVGFITVRSGLVQSNDSRIISKFLIWVFQPCLIARAFIVELTPEKMTGFLAGIAFATSVELIWIVLTHLIRKPLKMTSLDCCTLIYTNCGNLVLPLASMAFGEEYVFYLATFQVPFNILIWTHGNTMMKGENDFNLKKILTNTNIIAVFIGFFLLISQLKLPSVIDTASAGLSNMVGPTSMLIIGMTVAASDLGRIFRLKKAYLLTATRLLIYPGLIMLLLYITGITRSHPALIPVFMTLMLCVSAPPASTIAQLAVLYDNEPFEGSAYNIMGTILCSVTIPVIIFIYQFLFPV